MSFKEILPMSAGTQGHLRRIAYTLPAACTPASVRAALCMSTFRGSTAFSSDIAPALAKAANKSPSMVFSPANCLRLQRPSSPSASSICHCWSKLTLACQSTPSHNTCKSALNRSPWHDLCSPKQDCTLILR